MRSIGTTGRMAIGPAALTLLTLLSLPGTSPAIHAEVKELTLYQRCGRSPWVILGEVTDADDRFPEVRVIEVLKGSYERPTLRVVFRLQNWLRKGWEDKLAFSPGDKAILFLKRYDPEDTDGEKVPEKLRADDMFASTFGTEGLYSLPAEGQEAILEAVRAFSKVTAMMDPVAREDALLGFLGSRNPLMVEAGLDEAFSQRLALDDNVPVLLRLADDEREPIRIKALEVLGQVAEDLRAARRKLPDQPDVIDRLRGKVLGSGSDDYRAQALKVMVIFAGAAERPFLKRISKEDPSQKVRYEASLALVDLGN
jgi:hypothetical protein